MNELAAPAAPALGLADRAFRNLVLKQLGGLRNGELVLHDAAGEQRFGAAGDFRARLTVREPKFFRQAVLGGTLGVAGSYIAGEWDCDDLTALLRMFLRNAEPLAKLNGPLTKLAAVGQRLYHRRRANTRAGSKGNIAAHYDLGNDFYRLWLDDTMAYSCALFPKPDAALAEASSEKFDRVCRKLELQPRDHVVEIGTGWGGWAVHAAGKYGCKVTTTTISDRQHDIARQRLDAAGLQDRVTLLKQDYRDLTGQFDALASIEMIEAVGFEFFDQYFGQCSRLLKPDGTLVIQAIVMPERGYGQYLKGCDFIQRYVFPGGCVPSLGSMLDSVARASDLRFVAAEDFGFHYAETLRRWRRSFQARLDEVRAQGFGEDFIRLWNFYLCYCEAAFEEREVGLVQVQFDKPRRRRPLALPAFPGARP